MGRIIARDLAANRSIDVVVADRVGTGASFRKTDVTDPRSLARALRGAGVVIASLPYRFNLEAMRGALAAGAHFVDLGGLFHMTRRQLALAPAFREKGLMALLGMGSSPGIVNLLAVHAAEGLERVSEVHCQVGSVDRSRYVSAPPLGFGYSVETLLDEFFLPSAVFRNGKLLMVPPLDPAERVEARLPAPVGKLRLDTTLHSELATLPGYFRERGVREVTFRQGFDAGFVEKLSFLVRLGLAEPGPRRVLLELLGRFPPAVTKGKPWRYEVLRVVIRGRRGGKPVIVTADCHAGPKAGRGVGPDIDTGAPPSIAAQMIVSGAMPVRPGVWAPEEVVPLGPFFREVERRGMLVRRATASLTGGRSRAISSR
jgi:saccharopine dehydrogenase (NAD+, L-lysine-forming)